MSYPYARTYDEAYLYMELRPCVCGEAEFDRTTESWTEDGAPIERYSGLCPGCGRPRRFTFQMPAGPPAVSFDMRYGYGDEPSRLLDPGEWLGVSDLFEANASAELNSGDLIDEKQLTAIFYQLSATVAATEEVLKFIPAGADRVAEASFPTAAGRLAFELTPDRFTRSNLIAELKRRQQTLDDFERRYSEAPEDA